MVDGVRKKNKSLFLLLDNLKVKASIAFFEFLVLNAKPTTAGMLLATSLLLFLYFPLL